MARTTINIPYNCGIEEADKTVTNILTGNGFHPVTLSTGENVWKKGTGMLTAMQFAKVEYSDKYIVISAWIQVGVGSVGGNEMDLTGFVGAVPKKSLMKVLDKIKLAFVFN